MARTEGDDEEILVEEEEAEEWDDEETDEAAGASMGRLYLRTDRGGSSPADIAARLQSPQTLTETDLKWNSGYREPGWRPPRQPVQQIIKVLGKLEVIGGYRRPRDVFQDWLDLVEATLHMIPQHALYLRRERRFMPPEEEPPAVQEAFKRVRSHYGAERWQEAFKLFHEAYEILTDAAQGYVADFLGAIYMGLEIGNTRAGQYFSPWSIAHCMAQMTLLNIEQIMLDHMAEAIEAWEGHEPYKLMGMQWGRDYPNTTRWIWERHIDPLYLMTRHVRSLEPASGAGIMLLAQIASIPPWITNYQLIDYFAIDIDPMCAQMTRIQLLLFGANGYALLCQLPIVAPEDELPTFEQLEHRYQQIASHVQCHNALSHDWHLQENGIWTMLPWHETERGKRHIAEMEERAKQQQVETATRKEQSKRTAKVDRVKQQAKDRGQELLFDVEVPPIEIQVQAAAAIAGVEIEPATFPNGHTPGAAGDWTAFVERAKAQAGTVSPEVKAKLEEAVEQMAENLTQTSMF